MSVLYFPHTQLQDLRKSRRMSLFSHFIRHPFSTRKQKLYPTKKAYIFQTAKKKGHTKELRMCITISANNSTIPPSQRVQGLSIILFTYVLAKVHTQEIWMLLLLGQCLCWILFQFLFILSLIPCISSFLFVFYFLLLEYLQLLLHKNFIWRFVIRNPLSRIPCNFLAVLPSILICCAGMWPSRGEATCGFTIIFE